MSTLRIALATAIVVSACTEPNQPSTRQLGASAASLSALSDAGSSLDAAAPQVPADASTLPGDASTDALDPVLQTPGDAATFETIDLGPSPPGELLGWWPAEAGTEGGAGLRFDGGPDAN
jgi:hypothetical protein